MRLLPSVSFVALASVCLATAAEAEEPAPSILVTATRTGEGVHRRSPPSRRMRWRASSPCR